MFVKICGLREPGHVAAAVAAGADAIGFVLTTSPRQVTPERAAALAAEVPDDVLTVGVFATEPVARIRADTATAGLKAVQLHGGGYRPADVAALAADPVSVIRATAASATSELDCGAWGEDLLLVDAPRPGSGEPWDYTALPTAPTGRWLLAGGLYPSTVASAIAATRPWGVDVSSGVERSRGVKDPGLITEFIAAARDAD